MALSTVPITSAFPFNAANEPTAYDEETGLPIYDRTYNAEDLGSVIRAMLSDGVLIDYLDELTPRMEAGAWYIDSGAAVADGIIIPVESTCRVIDQSDIKSGQYAYLCVSARFDSSERCGAVYARISASPTEQPIRTESEYELILARVDWRGALRDLRMDNAMCGPVQPVAQPDTESFMKELSTAVSQFNLNVGEVTAQQPGSTPTVTVRKPEVAGGDVYIDFGIPRGAKGEPGRDGDTAPTMYINPEDEEPPRVYGNSWLVDDKATHTITAVKCYETDRVYPSEETFPGVEVYPGGTGQWAPHKLSRDLFAAE